MLEGRPPTQAFVPPANPLPDVLAASENIKIVPITARLTAANTIVRAIGTIPLPAGTIVGVGPVGEFGISTAGPQHGAIYAACYVAPEDPGLIFGALWAGYVSGRAPVSVPNFRTRKGFILSLVASATSVVAFPQNITFLVMIDVSGREVGGKGFVHYEAPGSGNGVLRTVTGANPVAGTEASDTVPTNAQWDLLAYGIPLVTNAVAGTRTSSLIVDDGAAANRLIMIPGPGQAPSLTRTHFWPEGYDTSAQGVVTMTDGATTVLMVPRLPVDSRKKLAGGSRIRTVTAGLDIGDDYAAPSILVEEWAVI